MIGRKTVKFTEHKTWRDERNQVLYEFVVRSSQNHIQMERSGREMEFLCIAFLDVFPNARAGKRNLSSESPLPMETSDEALPRRSKSSPGVEAHLAYQLQS